MKPWNMLVAMFPETDAVFSFKVERLIVCSMYVRTFGNYMQGFETFTAKSLRQYESHWTL